MAYDFDTIATRYDHMNRLMTLGLDRAWRRRAVRELGVPPADGGKVIDVACGTGDMLLELNRRGWNPVGVDLSESMLAIARSKTSAHGMHPNCLAANAEQLPFADGEFEAATCAFGVRNFEHLDEGLAEMCRVVKPGGRVVVLELSYPDGGLLLALYRLYVLRLIPLLGQLVAGNRAAYTYLPNSVLAFPKGVAFEEHLVKVGLRPLRRLKLTFGACVAYVAERPAEG
ncbi:MAG: ubiquinone/menaquinone biosynthesis methyltransferase [Bacteroidales bacterium]|nr:ubiquinone/menaquinone biosynthesis methyltransferase [Bacteroidales bacterium]